MFNNIPNRIRLTERKGISISTIKSLDNRYGNYETALVTSGFIYPRVEVVEGYKTEEEAIKGHEKYEGMSEEELGKLESIEGVN